MFGRGIELASLLLGEYVPDVALRSIHVETNEIIATTTTRKMRAPPIVDINVTSDACCAVS